MSYPSDTTPKFNDGEVETLKKILLALQGGISGGGGITLDGTERTPACSAIVATGSFAAGARSVTFVAGNTFAGTLLGQAFPAGASITFTAQGLDTLGAFAVTRTAGTLYAYWF